MWQKYYFLISEVHIGVTETVGCSLLQKNTERNMFPFKMNSQPLASFSKRLLIIFPTNLCDIHLGRFMGSNINVFLPVVSTFVHKTALDCHLHRTGHLSHTYDRMCTLQDSRCLNSR